ncbi:lytic murein transglycosylase [Aureimonas fodinaquatilis]|uniref:Lytic murein transglycosylase n=1 Tax=Aureimonas fodinaquatilis TaxID=2565783 RepID=A0A5B0E519_9HYPH|nr:lytic murein transglycosylase [Aureimonas fodinaquatilis]KAA0972529.1 lytic murein transglycosylase [Aureimonas fodinaquatilis]
MPGIVRFRGTIKPALISLALVIGGLQPAMADAGFQKWIADFEKTAVANGVSRDTYRAVFAGVRQPDPDVLQKARFQPEFRDAAWDYLDNRVNEETVANGRRMAQQYKRTLDFVERKYGVSRNILLAIWSMESSYGEVLQRPDVLKYVPQALATLAYQDQRRAKFAREQLIGAMKIVQKGHVQPRGLTGSWAGAMGHTQFIPTSYLAYAADGDGDGRADIWNSPADALATAANLLKQNGWQTGKTWGYEVAAPRGVNLKSLERANKTLGEWQRLGFRRANGQGFPQGSDNANLIMPAGANGPVFLMTRNFFVIKRYNNSDLYALGVGHLADRIAGGGEFVQNWPRGYTPLSVAERYELQQRLSRQGLYDGKIDGKIGSGSRLAISAYQRQRGVAEDGNASKALLDLLRRQ